MSRRHIPESPAHALRRARQLAKQMHNFAADCDAYASENAHLAIFAACAVKALGFLFANRAAIIDSKINGFVAHNLAIFDIVPDERKLITQERNNRISEEGGAE